MRKELSESYDYWVNAFVILGDTGITGGLFYLFYCLAQGTPWAEKIHAPLFQVGVTLMLCYALCAMYTGVVLFQRKVFAYEVLTRVAKNMILFSLLGGAILRLGGYVEVFSWFFLTYLLTVMLGVTIFRLAMRMGPFSAL